MSTALPGLEPLPGLELHAVEVHRLRMPLRTPFRTAHGTTHDRDVALVRVEATSEFGSVDGWGECVAQNTPDYTSEYTAGAVAVIERFALPAVGGIDAPVHAHAIGPALSGIVGHRMAKAAIEGAVLDAQLRAAGVSMADHLGASRRRIPVGVAIGMQANLGDLVATAGARLEEGYRRLKLKVAPGHDVEPVRALRRAFGDELDLQVDANGSYRPGDATAMRALRELDGLGLTMIEQPYPRYALAAHADLVDVLATRVCLDESIADAEVVDEVIRMGAANVLAIKPGRLGGHLVGRAVHDRCREAGMPLWHGGMLETGIGRAANLALAALPGFGFPADLSASARYFARDLVHPVATLDDDGTIAVPAGAGIGVEVDRDAVRDHRIERIRREWS